MSGAVGYRLDFAGLSFVFSGDAHPSWPIVRASEGGVDLFIHECFPPAATLAAESGLSIERAALALNAAHTWISEQARKTKTFKQFALHKGAYAAVRERFDLTAQVTVRCIAKVADAYQRDTKTQRHFRPHAAQPYDDRIFRFVSDSSLSIGTLGGRIKVDFVARDH